MAKSLYENALKKLDSFDLNTRISAIDEIANDPSQDAARALLDAFETAGWRDTKRYILSQLSKYLHYDRVFFALSPLLVESQDAQMASWVLNCFKYSKTNRYDSFLVHFFNGTESQIERNRILSALIHLTSTHVPTLIEKTLSEQELNLKILSEDPLPAEAIKKFDALPASFRILFNQFCGSYKLFQFKPLLSRLSSHRDYYISDSAYINLLKLGGGEDNRSQYELSLLEMESKDPVKEEFHQIYNENLFLQKATSLEKHLDYIFSLPSQNVPNPSILTLKLFEIKKIEEYLPIYESEKNTETLFRMLELLPFAPSMIRKTVRDLSSKFSSPKNAALAASALWRINEGKPVDVFEEFYKLSRSSEVKEGGTFFRWLALSQDPASILSRIQQNFFKYSPIEQSDVINLLVVEHQQFLPQKKVAQAIESFIDWALAEILKKDFVVNKTLVLRLFRACGQMGHASETFLQNFKRILTDKNVTEEERNGLIASLGNIDSPESHKLMVEIVQDSAAMFLSPISKRVLIRALSHVGAQIPQTVYDLFFDWADPSNMSLILRFLHFKPAAPGLDWLKGLTGTAESLSFNEKKWLIKAITQEPFEEAADWLFQEVRGEDETLRGLAIYALTHIQSDKVTKGLLDIAKDLIKDPANSSLVARIFRDLKPPKSGAEQVTKTVENLLSQSTSEQVYESIFGFLSQLVLVKADETRTFNLDPAVRTNVESRLLDELPRFAKLSPVVRSVLLNAEIPTAYPEIFNERVDKSTSVLQFIKAIDIYLKERLGSFLSSDLGQGKMQAIILAAGLDRYLQRGFSSQGLYADTIGTEILQDIELTQGFGLAEFPFGKLKSIVESILANKIFHEEFKVIDGLKAWGVLLLLFARPWGSRNRQLLIQPKADISIISVCKRMIELQDYRNPIAHRHTILELVPVEKIRKRTLTLLNDLQQMFD